MTVSLKELGSKLSYQEVKEILKLYAYGSDPGDPELAGEYDGQIWLDTRSDAILKKYNSTGGSWEVVGEVTAANLLPLIRSNDGSGSLIDADKLDGQEGSFYQNASNLNAGTVPLARIPAALTGKSADQVDGLEASQFIRSDAATDVSAHTEWQDNQHVRVGSGADGRFFHNGSATYIDNYTGHLYMRQLSHGNNIYLQAENASGTMKTLITIDPDADRVTTKLNRSSLPDLWRDNTTNEESSPYIQSGTDSFTDRYQEFTTYTFDYAFSSAPRLVVSPIGISDLIIIQVNTVTTTGFTARASYPTGMTTAHWLAIGKRT